MSHVHTVTPGSTAIAHAFAKMPDSDLNAVIVPPVPTALKIDSYFDFIEQLVPATQARRYMMWTACNSLNNFIIANLQSDIRQRSTAEREVNQDVEFINSLNLDKATIDKLNEQRALIDEMKAANANRFEQGFDEPVPAIDTAETLVNIRGYIASIMQATAKSTRDLAQPISDSIAFRLSKAPVVDEGQVSKWFVAANGEIPIEELRRVSFTSQMSDRTRLIEQMGEVIDLATQLSWKSVISASEVEGLFDKLPVHMRYKLLGGIVKSMKMAMAAEVTAFIRFGRHDSITNRVIISGLLDAYITFFGKFTSTHADELIAYEERGSKLPTLDELLADKT